MKFKIQNLIKFLLLSITMANLSIAQWYYQTNPIPPGSYVLGKVQFVSNSEGWITVGNGSLLHTTNEGQVWDVITPVPSDTPRSMLSDPAVSMSWTDDKHGWFIGWHGKGFQDARGAVLYYTTDGGVTWSKSYESSVQGEVGVQVQFINNATGWFSKFNLLTGQGQVYKTTDGGLSWNLAQMPLGLFYFVDSNNGWVVESKHVGPPPYGIFKTTNGGASWTKVYEDTIGPGFRALQFLDVNNGWVLGEETTLVLKTKNSGTTWGKVDIPQSVVRVKSLFFLNPDTGWISVKVWSSQLQREIPAIIFTSNGGATWVIQSTPNSNAGSVFSIYFVDVNNGWFTQDQCVSNCELPDSLDSLKVWVGLIGHTTNNGGVTSVEESELVIKSFELYQNYPNPFNPSTTIRFTLPRREYVTLKVFDPLGREVATLVDRELNAGEHSIVFDARDLPSGVYFAQMEAGNVVQRIKMMILK